MMNGIIENLKTNGKGKDLYQTWDCYDGPDKRFAKVIVEGDYEERHFVIAAHHGGHPNAYIEVFPWDSINYDEEGNLNPKDWMTDALSSVHCGSTYYGDAYWNEEDKRTYLGWDYGHAYDYIEYPPEYGCMSDSEDHKWSIAEILMDISRANYEMEMEMQNEKDFNKYWERRDAMKKKA